MKFLIIKPWIYDSAAYDFWLKPMGLLYIASILKKAGHEVEMIDTLDRYDPDVVEEHPPKDMYFGTGKFYNEPVEKPKLIENIPRKFKRYGMPKSIFIKKLKETKNIDAIITGITITYWYYGVHKTLEIVRNYFNDIPIFMGGVYTQLYPEHSKKTFNELGVNIINKKGIEGVNDILNYMGESKITPYDWFTELDPAYELYNSDLRYAVLTTSIGCPYNCSYCFTPEMWTFKTRNIRKIDNNIKNILKHKSNLEFVSFFDDAFLLRKNVIDLIKIFEKYDLKFNLANGVHAKIMNKNIAKALYKSDFKVVKLGYESSDPNLQKKTGDKVNDTDLKRAINILKNVGYTKRQLGVYIMSNMPDQKVEDVYRAIDYCHELGVVPNVSEFTPIPKTRDFYKLVQRKILPRNIDPLLLNNTYIPYWWKYGMSPEEIEEIKQYSKKARRDLLNDEKIN